MKYLLFSILCFSLAVLAACGPGAETQPAQLPAAETSVPTAEEPAQTASPTEAGMTMEVSMPFELTSHAFAQGETIPAKYSCDGDNVSPPLTWGDPPEGTQSLVLIMDDPDAPGGTWDHWVLFNIPADVRQLQENLPITGKNQDPDAIFVGNNSWGRADYGGPCPPSGTHRYFFKLYALDTTLSLLPGANKQEVLNAMNGHILAQTELMGKFSR